MRRDGEKKNEELRKWRVKIKEERERETDVINSLHSNVHPHGLNWIL